MSGIYNSRFIVITIKCKGCNIHFRSAKDKQLRIWKDYVAPVANLSIKDKEFSGKVTNILVSAQILLSGH